LPISGPRWAKVRRLLLDERSLTFLDRLHEDLAAAEPRPDVRAALVARWRGRRARRRRAGPAPPGRRRTSGWPGCWGGWCGPAAPWSASTAWCACTRRGTAS